MTDDLVALAAAAATAAGGLVLGRWAAVHEVSAKSSATDPVTEVDRAAEALIRAVIADHRPGDAVVGEETGRQGRDSEVWWVIDPLDGTVNFLRGRDEVAVSVAAVDEHGPVASCVHAPRLGRTYTAARGAGARLDGRPLTLGEPPALDRALVGTGFSYQATGRAAQAQTLARLLPLVADVRRGGSAALEICSVASGELDAFLEDDLAEWDWMGASLVVTEAGGAVVPVTSDRGTHGVAAGARLLVDALLRVTGDRSARSP